MTAYLRALDAHRDAQRKAITTRQAVVIAVGDAIERVGKCDDCGTRLVCEHLDESTPELSDRVRALAALDAAIPHLDDDGIRAVADALLGPEGAMP